MTCQAIRPVSEDLYSYEPQPRLVGGRHRESGRLVFPLPSGPEAVFFEPVLLSRNGRLWSFTVQRFRPKSPPYTGPEQFQPYAVGYVELPSELIVEARLSGVAFEDLSIGMPMELVVVPFAQDPDGTCVTTYAFRPVREACQ